MVSKEEIQRFIDTTKFSTYQKISLPHGLEIPGKDHSKKIEAIFGSDMTGKSVLDVGCYYGLYSHEAKRRGARRVVGVELNEERWRIASQIARYMDEGVEVLHGDALKLELSEKFDLVLFLSVLHHVKKPVEVMERLVDLCSDTVVVEFCLPEHRLRRKGHHRKDDPTFDNRFFEAARDFYRKLLVRAIGENVGLIITGDAIKGGNGYDWTYFFNKQAFTTLFQVQNKLFSEIRFIPSPQKENRMLAFCKV